MVHPTVCNTSTSQACYPYGASASYALSGKSDCGSCGNADPVFAVGKFTRELCLDTLVDAFIQSTCNQKGVATIEECNLSVSLEELVKSVFTFGSLWISMDPSVHVYDQCTVLLDSHGFTFGANAMRMSKGSLYCNFLAKSSVAQCGTYLPTLTSLLPELKTFFLRINIDAGQYVDSGPAIAFPTKELIMNTLVALPILGSFKVQAGQDIFKHFL
jgi:hypothetical protein